MKLEDKIKNIRSTLKEFRFTLREKVIIGALTLAGIIGLVNSGKTYDTGCETYQGNIEAYQGHINSVAEERRYVTFSKPPLEEGEEDGPIYSLLGNSEMSGGLERGRKYRLEVMKPTLRLFPEKLLSFKKCD